MCYKLLSDLIPSFDSLPMQKLIIKTKDLKTKTLDKVFFKLN